MANTPKAGCELMLKLLKSACANAENNFEMDPDNLYVAEAYATAGPILKRGRPRAQGRMYRINKRTSTSPSSWLRRHKGGGRRYGTES